MASRLGVACDRLMGRLWRGAAAVMAVAAAMAALALAAGAPAAAAGDTVGNASGRFDTLLLRDLGGKTAALVQMVADGDALTPVEVWRSAPGGFDVRKAKFVAADVDGNGVADGVALYDLGEARSRLYVWLSDGQQAVKRTAWTSRAGAFAWSRARLAVGDTNRDGRDDLLCLYDRGKGAAALYRFTSTGRSFRLSTLWTAKAGTFFVSRAQLAAGDCSGDGRDDAVVLYRRTTTTSRLYVFVTGSHSATRRTFWGGTYAAARARLAAGDVDSDGKADAVCLYRTADGSGRLDVFRSSGRAFRRATWYDEGPPPLPWAACRFAVGDLTGDGRGDAVLLHVTSSDLTAGITVAVSTGSGFSASLWWEGTWLWGSLRLGVAPAVGTVISDAVTVMDTSTLRALRAVSPDGTMTFAGETAQLDQVQPGDVLLAAPDGDFPGGVCRKVTAVSEDGGRVTVETAQATLTDVIEQGEVAFGMHVTPGDLDARGLRLPGVRLLAREAPPGVWPWAARGQVHEGVGFSISTVLAETAEIEGEVWLDPDAHVEWQIGWGGVERVAYTQVVTTETELTLSLRKELEKEVKQTLYKQTLGVITVMVGPVPVVVTPEFEVYVGASGTVTAGVRSGVSLTTQATLGVAYDRSTGWTVTKGITYDVERQPVQLFGSLELKGFAGAGLSFKVYAVAGPEAKVEPYLTLTADIGEVPWWTLKAGLDAEVGVEVEVLDITLAEFTATLNLFEITIDQAGAGGSGSTGDSDHYQPPSVRGTVRRSGDGAPVEGAAVAARPGSPPGGDVVATATTAADGSYVLWGLPPGTYTVGAERGGFAPAERTVVVPDDGPATGQDLTLAAYEDQGIVGRVVVVPGGAAAREAYVSLHEGTTPTWGFGIDGQYVASDGSYGFLGLEPGDYWLAASALYHFPAVAVTSVTAGHLTTLPDLELVPYDSQGVTGRVVSALDGDGDGQRDAVAGARVHIHEGWDAPAGPFLGEVTTAADGSYAITGLETGVYTLVAEKEGFVAAVRTVRVERAVLTTDEVLELAPYAPDWPARPVDGGDCIRYPEGVGVTRADGALLDAVTYELEFRLRELQAGTLLQVSYWYGNWPGGAGGTAPAMEVAVGSKGKLQVSMNQYDAQGPWPDDDYHAVIPEWDDGEVEPDPGKWYHVAVQFGPGGVRVFINGRLRYHDPAFTGTPEPDWSDGTLAGGQVCVGDNHTLVPGGPTALAWYRELRVSDIERYSADFTPPAEAVADGHTVLLDHLVGGTVGENDGFVWVP